MQSALPLACFLSMIRPPGVQFENSLLQIAPVDKAKCPFMRDHNDVEFRLYTRHNPTVYQELIIDDDEKLFASNMDYHAPTVMFFHAFMETTDDGSAARVREAYIIRGDTNVIMVDASRLEAGPWYFTAAENTWYIGQFAAKLIDYLVSRGLDLKRTHLIGHSLGAQAAGVAGSALKSGRVSRITGLDPALPLFHGLPESQRLDQTDADFVDVIHTDSGIFGVNQPVGHADFYPNGGISPQPGCELEVVIPQHMLLNKCKNHTQTRGFYTFYLTTHKITKSTRTLEKNLQKLFTKINSSKNIKKTEHQSMEIGKKGTIFATKQPVETKNQESHTRDRESDSEEDQMMVESVNRHHKTIPYYIAINNKENSTHTLKPSKTSMNFVNHDENTDVETEQKATDLTTHSQISTDDQEAIFKQVQEIIQENTRHNKNADVLITDNERTTYEDINKRKAIVEFNEQNTPKTDKKITNIDDQTTPKDNKETVLKPNIKTNTDDDDKTTFKDTKASTDKANTDDDDKITSNQKTTSKKTQKSNVTRQKRFINPFKRTEDEVQENFLFRMLGFLFKHGRNIPIYSVMREINTLVKSGQGELNHVTKERNNFIGAPPPIIPITYSLELGNESKTIAFMKRLLGLTPKGDRLTISGTGK